MKSLWIVSLLLIASLIVNIYLYKNPRIVKVETDTESYKNIIKLLYKRAEYLELKLKEHPTEITKIKVKYEKIKDTIYLIPDSIVEEHYRTAIRYYKDNRAKADINRIK